MKVQIEINESEWLKAAALHSALVHDREQNPEEYVRAAQEAICELHRQFVLSHTKYNDRDFKILQRFLQTINHFDFDAEDGDSETYDARAKKLDYKTLDRFDKDGKFVEEE